MAEEELPSLFAQSAVPAQCFTSDLSEAFTAKMCAFPEEKVWLKIHIVHSIVARLIILKTFASQCATDRMIEHKLYTLG